GGLHCSGVTITSSSLPYLCLLVSGPCSYSHKQEEERQKKKKDRQTEGEMGKSEENGRREMTLLYYTHTHRDTHTDRHLQTLYTHSAAFMTQSATVVTHR